MISKKMLEAGSRKSIIRVIYDFGKERAAQIGAENVYDFSLGNPSVPAPEIVHQSMKKMMEEEDSVEIHGYTHLQGDINVRNKIAADINKKHGTSLTGGNIYMTTGATASLRICFSAIANPGDEFLVIAPFFPEYRVGIEQAGGTMVVIPARTTDFQIDFEALEKAINPATKAVIINSPNNPSGVVYTRETIDRLTGLLKKKQDELGQPIYLISDEPYREILFSKIDMPYLLNEYDNTMVCYSYSKSLSIPGERIGYIAFSPKLTDYNELFTAACGSARYLGFVNAPSMFQKVAAACNGEVANIEIYRKNRDLLYEALISYGYECVKPEGAFYLFPKAMEEDASAFCAKGREFNLLLLPSDDFGCKGHVRIAYCVDPMVIERSLPAFKKLAECYGRG